MDQLASPDGNRAERRAWAKYAKRKGITSAEADPQAGISEDAREREV